MTPDPHVTLATAEVIYVDTCVLVKIEKYEGQSTKVINIVVYWSSIPVFVSLVTFGEFVSVLGREEGKALGLDVEGYLCHCRKLMTDLDRLGKIHRAEPTEDPTEFCHLAGQLMGKYAKLGGGDIWHLLTVYELQKTYPGVVFLTWDRRLANAARVERLNVIDGNGLAFERAVQALTLHQKYKDPLSRL